MAESIEEETFINPYPKLVDFEGKFRIPDEETSFKTKVASAIKCGVNACKHCNAKECVFSYLPIVETVMNYKVKEYLPNDMIAGITAGVMMIPQGMAFAALSTLPPIVGLYISLFASITYVFFGTGKQLSWGCIAILSLMMANILDKYDNSAEGKLFILTLNETYQSGDTDAINNTFPNNDKIADAIITARRMEVASGVSVIAGLVLILASRIGLSRITAIMSNSLITGFTVGISVHVATSQLKGLLGLSIVRYKGIGQLIRTWIAILENLPETNVAALIISLICMIIIYLVKRFVNEKFKDRMRIPIPIELFVVIIATLVSYYGHFNAEFDVKIVEDVPTGVPKPKFPDIPLVSDYIGDALVIIIVSYAQSLAMAKTMGLKHDYIIDSNQEMLAAGACSIVCGFFSGYITGASVSRTVVQDGAGGKTQVASIFAAGLVFLVIMVIGPYFYYLPTCVLSAIIVINLRTMFLKLLLIPGEWSKSRYDCAVWVFAFLATIVLNADIGLLAGVIFSLCLVVFRSMINPVEEVGQIQTNATAIQLRSLENYGSVLTLETVKIIKIKTALYFFNADSFIASLFEKTEIDPTKIKALQAKVQLKSKDENNLRNGHSVLVSGRQKDEESQLFSSEVLVIILDISEVSFIDKMGVGALEHIIKEYTAIGVEVLIISVPENLFGILHSTGFWKKQGDRLFLTIETALASIAATIENQGVRNTNI